jgi:molybdenum cofactor sulfurtransferase
LRHGNGRPVVIIYGPWKRDSEGKNIGPTVAFNILRDDGSFVGYNEVSKLAAINRPPIQLRTGCFCNPGACQAALELTDQDVIDNYKTSGHVCGDQIDIINGKPTGAIRASFGKDSIWEDVDALVSFIERLFVGNKGTDSGLPEDGCWDDGPRNAILSELFIYPIKSCAAQRVKQWKFQASSGRLLFDREFALVDSSGTAMRLSVYPKMSQIRPSIDLSKKTMIVAAPGHQHLKLSLDEAPRYADGASIVKICGNRCGGIMWGSREASDWFSEFLGVQCWLARYYSAGYQLPEDSLFSNVPLREKSIAFANEQPLLLISEHAVDALNDILAEARARLLVSSRNFRPNFVVRLVAPCSHTKLSRVEDGWSRVQLCGKKTATFDVVGQCARCSMVDVDPSSGMEGNTLRALADYRRSNGQISFGIFLRGTGERQEDVWVREGDLLICQ